MCKLLIPVSVRYSCTSRKKTRRERLDLIASSSSHSSRSQLIFVVSSWYLLCNISYVCQELTFALTRESGSRFRPPPEAEIPKLLKTKLCLNSVHQRPTPKMLSTLKFGAETGRLSECGRGHAHGDGLSSARCLQPKMCLTPKFGTRNP